MAGNHAIRYAAMLTDVRSTWAVISSGLLLCTASAATGAAPVGPAVAERYGNIEYLKPGGGGVTSRSLTSGGGYGEPALSPDGRTVAFIHVDKASSDKYDGPVTSLWIADGPTGSTRRLVAPLDDEPADLRANSIAFGHPAFSLDGHFIYVTAALAAVSPGIHQVNVETGAQRFVIDGSLHSVIRTGPYRGYLIVGRHMYRTAPEVGSYDAAYVVQPDGKVMFMVPGSDQPDDSNHVSMWLRGKGWKSW